VRHTLAGDSAAFAGVVERHHRALHGFLFRLLLNRHDTEDLVQETFLAAYRQLARYDARYSFKTWLFTIGRRQAISVLRRRRMPVMADLPDAPEPADAETAGDVRIMRYEAARSLHAALAELPSDYRQALWLFYVEEQSVSDIAAILGKTALGTRVLLHRARHALRRHLLRHDALHQPVPAALPLQPDLILGGD